MVVFNEGIHSFLEIIIFNYKMPVMSPAVPHAKHTWLQQPEVSSLQLCANVKLRFMECIFMSLLGVLSTYISFIIKYSLSERIRIKIRESGICHSIWVFFLNFHGMQFIEWFKLEVTLNIISFQLPSTTL